MFSRHRAKPSTSRLASSAFLLTEQKRRPGWFVVIGIVVLISVAAFALQPAKIDAIDNVRALETSLKMENEMLVASSRQSQLALEHEVATRKALEKEIAAQADELKRLRKELSFFRSHQPSNDKPEVKNRVR